MCLGVSEDQLRADIGNHTSYVWYGDVSSRMLDQNDYDFHNLSRCVVGIAYSGRTPHSRIGDPGFNPRFLQTTFEGSHHL